MSENLTTANMLPNGLDEKNLQDFSAKLNERQLLWLSGYFYGLAERAMSYEPLAMSHEPANDSILESSKLKAQSSKLNWHFKAQNVHDFVWAADPER